MNGRYIVADPEICHGQPTFRGTRILVSDVLDQIAEGLPVREVVASWNGRIGFEAVAEAVQRGT